MMNTNTIQVIDQGLRCLSENLGMEETGIFISTLLREKFDYTKWRQSFVNRIETFEDLDAFLAAAKEKRNFNGHPATIL